MRDTLWARSQAGTTSQPNMRNSESTIYKRKEKLKGLRQNIDKEKKVF